MIADLSWVEGLPDDARQRLLQEAKKQLAYGKIADYYPDTGPLRRELYPKHLAFFAGGLTQRIRMMMAANRCITPWTPIEMAHATRQCGEILGEASFDVRSWDGGSRRTNRASGVFLKGIEPAFRLHLDNGQFVDCTRRHRVLTTEGWLSLGQIVHRASGLHCMRTVPGSTASCATDARHGGGPLRRVSGSGRAWFPSASDAQELDPWMRLQADEEGPTQRCRRVSQGLAPFANLDDPGRIADLIAPFADPAAALDAQWPTGLRRELWQFALEYAQRRALFSEQVRRPSWGDRTAGRGFGDDVEILGAPKTSPQFAGLSLAWLAREQSKQEFLSADARTAMFVPFDAPLLVGNQRILAVVPLGLQPILDFTVEHSRCYESGGVIHHNTGKTEGVGLYESTCHMTGEYPSWWVGKRFAGPVRVWLAGDTSKTVRETLQIKLLGPWNEFGTGVLPADKLEKWTPKAGVPETVDTFTVRHASGGLSRGVFKSYDQKREAFQGSEQEIILLDEEPALDIYGECVIRTMTTGGIIMLTFTPLAGMTKLIKHLRSSHVFEVGATWDDVPHLSQTEKDELWNATPEYMRDARAKGIPARGSGVVFTVSRHTLEVEPFNVPSIYTRIGGLDFGWDHPSAAVELCHNRETDVLYVTKEHQQTQATPLLFSAAIKPWGGKWLPWAWPHDGLRQDKDPQGGRQVAQMYRDLELNLTAKPASWNDETLDNSVEPGVLGMLEFMQAGRFKVFKSLTDWWKQFDDYHRKDGVIVKEDDDLMDATRIAFMMRRFAVVKPSEMLRRQRPPNWKTM